MTPEIEQYSITLAMLYNIPSFYITDTFGEVSFSIMLLCKMLIFMNGHDEPKSRNGVHTTCVGILVLI